MLGDNKLRQLCKAFKGEKGLQQMRVVLKGGLMFDPYDFADVILSVIGRKRCFEGLISKHQ